MHYFPYRSGILSVSPAIAMCSTAHDMALWMAYHLHAGTSTSTSRDSSRPLLPVDLWEDLHSTVTAIPDVTGMYHSEIQQPLAPVNYVLDGYGLGWFTGHYRGEMA